MIAIGASHDGIQAISHVLAALPADFAAPIVITQHIGRQSHGYLPQILSHAGTLHAVHPADGGRIVAGTVYVAPPDRHLLVERGVIRLSHGPEECFARPSIDVMFRSVALAYGPAAVGVILTGFLHDGTAGLLAIKEAGGVTIVQDPDEASAPDMPRNALARVTIDHVCKLAEIAPLLLRLIADPPGDAAGVARTVALENQIAAGDRAALAEMVRRTPLTALACPTCGSSLHALDDPHMRRYRCVQGHAVSAGDLGDPAADLAGAVA